MQTNRDASQMGENSTSSLVNIIRSYEGEQTVKIELSVLKQGSKGSQVKTLQNLWGITIDGSFGPATDKAVRTFQKTSGLAVDGSVGTNTWTKLLKG